MKENTSAQSSKWLFVPFQMEILIEKTTIFEVITQKRSIFLNMNIC